MWHLYQFALCPFGRLVRLVLNEKRIAYRLVDVSPWKRLPGLRQMHAIGSTPVLHEPGRRIVLAGSGAICEYLEEVVPTPSLLPGSAEQRAEVRRLVAWAQDCVFSQVTRPLLNQCVVAGRRRAGDNVGAVADAAAAADEMFAVIAFHLDDRAWIAGPTLNLADFAIAAQISVAEHLGGIDWLTHSDVRAWYSVLKGRPSFMPLLADAIAGIAPPSHYADPSF